MMLRRVSAWGLMLTAAIFLVSVLPAAAQVRFATGGITGNWNEYNPNKTPLTTSVTTGAGRVCGPPDGCAGIPYPGFASNATIAPANTAGAILYGGTGTGDAVSMPASQWELFTGGVLPSGIIPGVVLIQTEFRGKNADGLAASGNGWSAGGGPGNTVFNPAAASIPGGPYVTRTFAGATSPYGSTVISGNPVTVTMPTLPAQPDSQLRWEITAGPRQYGGTVEILTDTPNNLILAFPTGNFTRTNGRCPPAAPFGDCASGFSIGKEVPDKISARVYKAATLPVTITAHYRWYGAPWTTGTISAVGLVGTTSTSFASSGTDVGGASRNLVMVSPSIEYGLGLTGAPASSAFVWTWDMTFTPEPTAAMGLLAGLGALGFLYSRRGTR